MLILVRKAGQNLVINDNIIVKILEVKKDQVKIGIVAPKEISVHRQEVFEMIKEANRNAAVKKAKLPKIQIPRQK
ncbi:MAG: carbon storage regulator CsrA [Firmicutes bacterium]|nr:carbon storage regulator CsrA [Bacillota bacterium]